MVAKSSAVTVKLVPIEPKQFRYTFTIMIKDNKVKYVFDVGQSMEWNAYPPEDSMQEIESKFQEIKTSITTKLNSNTDF